MIILGIETSCDETSGSILKVTKNKFELLSLTTFSQIKTHRKYGGVVPEVAARLHVPKIIPIIDATLEKAGLALLDVDVIAVTVGPGLITSLMVGIHTAKTLSFVLKKPVVSVNHMEGHIVSSLLSEGVKNIKFPGLCLTVSGGHTEIVLVKKFGDYKIIGKTRDDAVGEAFDKVAKILDLPYPGGPEISKIALLSNTPIKFPAPMLNSNDLDFSFSGLKTSVLYYVKNLLANNCKKLSAQQKADIACGFQNSTVEVLVYKTIKAIKKYKTRTFMIGGGVSANNLLRESLITAIKKADPHVKILIPDFQFCTDNAAMIAMAGYFMAKNKKFSSLQKLEPNPILKI